MPSEKLTTVSGEELNRLVEEFLATVSDWTEVKVLTIRGSTLVVHILRCSPFQEFLKVIQNRAICAQLSHQHDAILRFLNRVFFKGEGTLEVPSTPVAGDTSSITTHDLVVDGIAWQFKTMNNVSDACAATFLRKYVPAMRKNAARVPHWWLGFLRKISPPKSRKRHLCFTYLVLVDVDVDRVVHTSNAVLESEVISLVQQAQEKVKREDDLGDGFLLPVKNIWVVDQLKEELAERDKMIARLKKENATLKKRLEDRE